MRSVTAIENISSLASTPFNCNIWQTARKCKRKLAYHENVCIYDSKADILPFGVPSQNEVHYALHSYMAIYSKDIANSLAGVLTKPLYFIFCALCHSIFHFY